MTQPALMKTGEVAKVLRVHPRTVLAMIRDGRLEKAVRLGERGDWRVPRASVEAMLGGSLQEGE